MKPGPSFFRPNCPFTPVNPTIHPNAYMIRLEIGNQPDKYLGRNQEDFRKFGA
jgi:hypothetical protein